MMDEIGPSLTVLEETPGRALDFLTATSHNQAIFTALSTRGYGEEDHVEGWEMLFQASGYRKGKLQLAGTTASREAAVEIDNWDEPNFRIIFAALKRRHPDQFLFVSHDLKPAVGPASLVSVTLMLDRLDELENGKDRVKTRKADHAALVTLSARGITKEERARIRKLLAAAVVAPAPVAAPTAPVLTTAEERLKALGALRKWYEEWSEVARAVIKRRDWLILLGLAKRRKANGAAALPDPLPEPNPPAEPVTATQQAKPKP